MADDGRQGDPTDEKEDDTPAAIGHEALAASAGGGAVGGAGAALLTGEGSTAAVAGGIAGPAGVPLAGTVAGPAGVPLSPGVGVGSAGVPIGGVPFTEGWGVAGPGGVPTAGSGGSATTGVPIDSGSAPGPIGVDIVTPIKVARRGRTIGFVAAGVAAIAVIVVVVAITSGDDSPTVSDAPGVSETVPASSDASPTTAAASAVSAVPPPTASVPSSVSAGGGPACTVGSWVADNASFGTRFDEFAGGVIADFSVTGEVLVDIAVDGAVTTTFSEFLITAVIPEAGTSEVGISGVESSTITFADDGTYSVIVGKVESIQVLSANGVVLMSGPSPQPAFYVDGTYLCSRDDLVLTFPGDFGDFVEIFHRSG